MRELTRVAIPLSKDEFLALQERASQEYRHPRDQARYLLRAALGLDSPKMHNGTVSSGLGNRENGAAVSLPG